MSWIWALIFLDISFALLDIRVNDLLGMCLPSDYTTIKRNELAVLGS